MERVSSVPFVDLAAQMPQIEADIRAGWDRVLAQTSFVLGEPVERFENALAEYLGVDHAVGVGSGTDALELAFRALGVGAGDEVIVPANTFIATPLAVVRAGASPVFVDVDPATLLIDPSAVRDALTPRTKVIAPVHLFGQMAPMAPLVELARQHDLFIVEDAAQAQGARQDGRTAGSIGDVAATSFYPGKNLGAFGDGGAVLTRSDAYARRLRALRNYGSEVKYHHPIVGFNSRLDGLQAVVLEVKLRRLDAWNEARRAAAARYDRMLDGISEVSRISTRADNVPVHHLYVVRVEDRDGVRTRLGERGVITGVHYPVPCHLQGAFTALGHRAGSFPVAEAAAGSILSLPMFPEITEAQQNYVIEALEDAVRGG